MFKSIKAKILLLSLGLTFFNILIFFFSIYFDYSKEKINKYSIDLLNLESLILKDTKTIKDFILSDLNNPIFFYTKNSIHFEEHKVYAAGVKSSLTNLISDEKNKKDTLNYIFKKYSMLVTEIDTLFELGIRNGFQRKEIKNEINQIAELLKRRNLLSFQDVNQLSQFNSEFQSSRDKISFNRLVNQVYKSKLIISENHDLSQMERNKLLAKLSNYLERVRILHDMDIRIGIDINEGLKGKIDKTLLEITSIIISKNEIISKEKSTLTSNFRLIFIFLSLFIILSAIIISIQFSKNNTERLSALSEHITKFIKSKFNYKTPLFVDQKDDEIGLLIKSYQILQVNLTDHIHNLEIMVKKRTSKIENQKNCITKQKEELLAEKVKVEKQNENILFSINYAKRIQEALLENSDFLNSVIFQGFIFYEPRDIVSGDFYWIKHVFIQGSEYTFIAAADCTGHGVPGAFMSLLGISYLNDVLMQYKSTKASENLNYLREKFISNISNSNGRGISDGLDIAFCIYNHDDNVLQYAGANRPLYIIRKNTILEYNPDTIPIGKYYKEFKGFTNNEIKIFKGDKVYIFTDGITDQFNEEDVRKYTRKKLKELLLKMNNTPLNIQSEIISEEFRTWKGNNQQTDDVLFIGMQFLPDTEEPEVKIQREQYSFA